MKPDALWALPPHGLCHTVTANSIHVCFHHLVFFIMLRYFNTLMNYRRWRRFWHIIQFIGDRHTCSDTSHCSELRAIRTCPTLLRDTNKRSCLNKKLLPRLDSTIKHFWKEDRKGKGRTSSILHATFHMRTWRHRQDFWSEHDQHQICRLLMGIMLPLLQVALWQHCLLDILFHLCIPNTFLEQGLL